MIGLKWGRVPLKTEYEGRQDWKVDTNYEFATTDGRYQPGLSMDSMTSLVQAVDGRAYPMNNVSERSKAAKSLGSLRDKALRQHTYLV